MSRAHIAGVQTSKILDYRRSNLRFALPELAIPWENHLLLPRCVSRSRVSHKHSGLHQDLAHFTLGRLFSFHSTPTLTFRGLNSEGKRCKEGTQQCLIPVPSSVLLSETTASGPTPHQLLAAGPRANLTV